MYYSGLPSAFWKKQVKKKRYPNESVSKSITKNKVSY